jgi:hypothetical protein
MIEEAVTDECLLLEARTDTEASLLGWTTDGRANVAGGCKADQYYLYSLDGTREPWAGPKDGMEPSLHPLDLGG